MITLKSIHSFKLGSAKSMFAFILFLYFSDDFPSSNPVCVCVSAFFKLHFIIFVRMLVAIFCMAMQSNVILKYKV